MLILIAIIMIICGVLLILKTKKMPKEQGLHIVVGVCAVIFIVLGAILGCCVISGKIALPLH